MQTITFVIMSTCSNIFSKKPHSNTTMGGGGGGGGGRVEKGKWKLYIRAYTCYYLKLQKEARQVNQKFFDF